MLFRKCYNCNVKENGICIDYLGYGPFQHSHHTLTKKPHTAKK